MAKGPFTEENPGALPLVPREKIDDVRDRTNIVDVVKRYVELKRAGTGSWKGLCPFHTEKTPSFHVHETRQFFHCFGCGEKGDVFGFLQKIDQRSFTEVLRDLAQQAGVELPEREMSPGERRARQEAESERDRLLRVMELATAFFEACFAAPPGEAERLGLVGVNERGRYDFFRDRVMLPVFDRQKRVIGFGSRLLDPEAKDRKYVNSPDSPLFHKKECLYGLHVALEAIRKSGTAIVVEGNFDVMALHEAGIEEAVAPMGAALTMVQVGMLARVARRAVVIFDGDAAGKRAAEKAVPLFVDGDLDGRVARLPGGQDPDDFVRQQGAAAFRQLIEAGRPMLDQFIQDAAQETTVPGRIATLESVAALLVRVRDRTTQELYAQRLAAVLGLTPHQVGRALRDAREHAQAQRDRAAAARSYEGEGAPAAATPPPAPAVPDRVLPRDEMELLALLVTYPEVAGSAEAARGGDLLVDPAARELYRTARQAPADNGRLDVPAWRDAGPPDVRRSLSAALMDGGHSQADNPSAKLRALTARLELQRVEAEISRTAQLLEQARSRGDVDGVNAAMRRSLELGTARQGLKTALQRP